MQSSPCVDEAVSWTVGRGLRYGLTSITFRLYPPPPHCARVPVGCRLVIRLVSFSGRTVRQRKFIDRCLG